MRGAPAYFKINLMYYEPVIRELRYTVHWNLG